MTDLSHVVTVRCPRCGSGVRLVEANRTGQSYYAHGTDTSPWDRYCVTGLPELLTVDVEQVDTIEQAAEVAA